MKKIWFIIIGETEEGPYSFEDLKADLRITPDTLAWREGFEEWVPIGAIPELQDLFKDEDETSVEEEKSEMLPQEEIALDYQGEPSYFLFWILLFIIVMLVFYYWNK